MSCLSCESISTPANDEKNNIINILISVKCYNINIKTWHNLLVQCTMLLLEHYKHISHIFMYIGHLNCLNAMKLLIVMDIFHNGHIFIHNC